METFPLIALLSLGTMAAVLVFALVSRAKVKRRMEDDSAPKSTLAADAPDQRTDTRQS